MAIKEVYKNGFTANLAQDENPVIPAILDVVRSNQVPTEYPIEDFIVWDDSEFIEGGYSAGSAKFMLDITKPTSTTTTLTGRVEQWTRYPHFSTNEDRYFSISYRFPSTNIPDNLSELLYQSHIGTGTPSFSLRRVNGRLQFTIFMASGNENTMHFDVGAATNEVWHHFLVRVKFRNNEDGMLTIWKDGELARLYNPYTGDKWKVPTESTPGVNIAYVAKPAMGYISKTVIEGEEEVSVLDWRGVTTRVYPNPDKYEKWGFYKSSWGNLYDEEGNLNPDVYDPQSPLYVEPNNRNKTMWISNVKYELFDRVSIDTALRSLSPFGELPSDFPDWYEPDIPINITYPSQGANFTEGQLININTDAENGDLELLVNDKSISSKSIPPYNFSIQDIPLNGAVIDFPFNGDLFNWGAYNNIINTVRPNNIFYVDGVRGQAIKLFQDEATLNADRAYISIPNVGPLSEISTAFTISFWLKGPATNISLLSNIVTGNSGIRIYSISSGLFNVYLYDSEGNSTTLRISSGSVMNPDTFNHFSVTYDGDYLRWYYNFEYQNQLQVGEIDVSASNDWRINAAESGFGLQNIVLDDFRIYDYAVSEEDIDSLGVDNHLGQLKLEVRRFGILSDPVTINIVEELPTFTITATATTGGQVSGDGEYEENEEVTLTATPDSGYEFVGWEEDSETVSTANPYIFNAEGDRVLLAVFELIPPEEYTISVTSTSGGNATGGGVYEEDDPVTLTATPDTGYEFVGWEENESIISTSNPYIFNAEEDRSLLAVFQQIEYQLTVTYTAGGTATGSGEYIAGSQVQLTATPNLGYNFVGWYRGGTLISDANPYNYTTRSQPDTVEARFELIPIPEFTITVIPSTGGTVTGGGTYEEGQSVTLSAMPQSGWTFVKWSNDATDNPYSFTASENLTISAIFEEVDPEVPYIIVKGKFKIV